MSDPTKSKDSETMETVVGPPVTELIPLPADDMTANKSGTTVKKIQTSQKGIENAKKRLRAFSIQKKKPVLPTVLAKSTGPTVVIGKLASSKPSKPPPDPDAEQRRLPKPPKPGGAKKNFSADSYVHLQKRTLAEIEDMKRKMELVELGIPLGLICPQPNSDATVPTKAMPTKAMPPIKTFLGPAQVDELIREAKKAKAAGKEFKFDYHKLLPDYDNPFQRKREESKPDEKPAEPKKFDRFEKSRVRHRWFDSDNNQDKDRKKTNRNHDSRKHSDYKKEYRDKDTSRDRDKDKIKNKGKVKQKYDSRKISKESVKIEKDHKEADVNLNDYLVCDSWSLDTEEKNETSSPKVDDSVVKSAEKQDVKEQVKDSVKPQDNLSIEKKKFEKRTKSPVNKEIVHIEKIEKLQPVMDILKFEIDPEDDGDMLDIFDKNNTLDIYSKSDNLHKNKPYSSPKDSRDSYSLSASNENSQNSSSMDEFSSKFNNDNFLESVINEIKQDDMSDDMSQDKGFLVGYDLSPERLDNSMTSTPEKSNNTLRKSGSVTPELDDSYYDMCSSQRSDCSESGFRSSESGFRSTESGCKSSESGYKSNESYRIVESTAKEFDDYHIDTKMSKATIDSLDMWSFVLKICQPLLFRHDSSKCYRSTMVNPKLWYTENPKICICVKDRSIVYEELEACKMGLVDRVYGCDQIPDAPYLKNRVWYPRVNQCLSDNMLQLMTNWETDDSSQNSEVPSKDKPFQNSAHTNCDEMTLDREYKKFMEAVWPEVSESKGKKKENSRSNTPKPVLEMGARKRKKEKGSAVDDKLENQEEFNDETKRKRKKVKNVSGDDWSQESDIQKEKSSKRSKTDDCREKKRKKERKDSSSDSDSSLLEEEGKNKSKKKNSKHRSKSEKRRRLEKKRLRKLKEKQKKKLKKLKEMDENSEEELEIEKKAKDKKMKKKKLKHKKRKQKKKKARTKSLSSSDSTTTSSSSSSSSESSSSSDSESEKENRKKKRKAKEAKKERRRMKKSESPRHDAFDMNILKNIKTERLTDDEKAHSKASDLQDFSPRKQNATVQREIVNVKELHNDIVANNLMHIKQEVIEEEEVHPQPVLPILEELDAKINMPEVDHEVSKVQPEEQTVEFNNVESFQEIPIPPETHREIPDIHQDSSFSVKEDFQESTICGHDPETELGENIYGQEDNFIKYFDSTDTIDESKCDTDAVQIHYEYEQCYGQYGQMDYQQQDHLEIQSGVSESRPIETLVSASGCRGEIKCDWRPGQRAARHPPARPSRWGLKPNDVNIVLSDGTTQMAERVYQIRSVLDTEPMSQTYRIETISTTRLGHDTSSPVVGYDEAYADTYGAADRLQYGDCFGSTAPSAPSVPKATPLSSHSLDARIDRALKETVLGLVTQEATGENNDDLAAREKSILANKSGLRGAKRVSFADGYAPGQDSDTEPPPKKKKKIARLRGCAWPCPVSHPDHVPLWDALPPPDPPPGSPPRPAAPERPALLPAPYPLRRGYEPAVPLPALQLM